MYVYGDGSVLLLTMRYICMYVGKYACMFVYVCVCVCMHACMYVCKDAGINTGGGFWAFVDDEVCMYVCVCMYMETVLCFC